MSKPTLDLFSIGVMLSRQARHLHPNPPPCIPRPRDYVVPPIGMRSDQPTDGELDEMFREMELEANEANAAAEREHAQPGNFHDN